MSKIFLYGIVALYASAVTLGLGATCIRRISNNTIYLRSGDSVFISQLKLHLQNFSTTLDAVAHLIYVYDPHNKTLMSCVNQLNVPVQKYLTNSQLLNHQRTVPLTVNNIQRKPVNLGNLRFDHANSVSFLHESVSNRLLAVYANRFHLNRVETAGKNVVLVDVLHRSDDHRNRTDAPPPNLVSHILQEAANYSRFASAPFEIPPAKKHQNCIQRKLEIEFMWDETLCAQFENNARYTAFHIEGTISKILEVFEQKTCVSVSIFGFHGFCKDGSQNLDPLAKMPSLDSCGDCRPPTIILEAVRNFWFSRNASASKPDVSIFISGYDDGTAVVGAAYVGGACTPHRFGWVENLTPQVLAHEIGHLLGARHGSNGLMRSIIDTTEVVPLSKASATEISKFVNNPNTGWCLSNDDKQKGRSTQFRDIGVSVSGELEPVSVHVFSNQVLVGIKFLVLIRNKTHPLTPPSFLRYERLSLSGEEYSNNTKFWNDKDSIDGPISIPLKLKGSLVSAAITMSKFNLPIILTVQRSESRTLVEYSFAKGNKKNLNVTSWRLPRPIPANFKSDSVVACSIARSKNNLIFAFAKKLEEGKSLLFYIVARSVGYRGIPSNGWTDLRQLPLTINGTVMSMNVVALEFLSDGLEDLIFSYTMIDSEGKANIRFVVGFSLSSNGVIGSGWSQEAVFTPKILFQEDKQPRTSIGHAIDVSPRSFKNSKTGRVRVLRLPSVGYIDTIERSDRYRLVMQHQALTNGIFNEASIVENGEVFPACMECYSESKVKSCVNSRLECSEAKATLPIIEKDEIETGNRMTGSRGLFENRVGGFVTYRPTHTVRDTNKTAQLEYPDSDETNELYCAGVYKVFVEKTGGSCAGKVSDPWIASTGLALTVQNNLYNELNVGQANSTWRESDLTVTSYFNGTSSNESLDGAFYEVDGKGPSDIKIFSKKRLRLKTIVQAIENSKLLNDFDRWYKKKKPKIERKPSRKPPFKFVVILSFESKFL